MRLNISSSISFFIYIFVLVTNNICTFSNAQFSNDFNMFPGEVNMSDANFTYKPSAIIQSFHNIPHIASDGTIVKDPKFVAGYDHESKIKQIEYIDSLFVFPIILFLLGFTAQVCFGLGMNDYFTWLVPKLGPKSLDPDDETITGIALYTHANEVSRKNWMMYFFIAMFVALFGTNFFWYGNTVIRIFYS